MDIAPFSTQALRPRWLALKDQDCLFAIAQNWMFLRRFLRYPLMEWSGRELNSGIAVIGIDIGKNSFHVVGHD